MKIKKCSKVILFMLFLLLFVFLQFVQAEVIDDFEDGVINENIWWYGGGVLYDPRGTNALGDVYETDGSLVLYCEDLARWGGGVSWATLRNTPLDTRIYFSFELTIEDTHLNNGYIPGLMFRVAKNDIGGGGRGSTNIDFVAVHHITHDQQTTINQLSGTYYYYIDSAAQIAYVYDAADDSLLGSASYAVLGTDTPYILFDAYSDTFYGEVYKSFKIEEIWTEETSLVAHWSFNDESDPGHDDSGNGNTLTIPYTWNNVDSVSNQYGNAISFDRYLFTQPNLGSVPRGPYISRSKLNYPGPEGFTIMCWAKVKDEHQEFVRSYWQHRSCGDLFGLFNHETNKFMFRLRDDFDGVPDDLCFDSSSYIDQWVHLTCVYNPNGYQRLLYVNGELKAIDNLPKQMRSQLPPYFYVSGNWHGTYPETIDEVRIYNKALSAEEIAELAYYNSAPIANAGEDQTVEASSHEGALVTLDGSGSSDPDSSPGTNDDIVSFDWYIDDMLIDSGEIINTVFSELDSYTATLVVKDSYGETDEDVVIITVEDTNAPVINSISADPNILWSPNHKMVKITVTIDCEDNYDPEPVCKITEVTCNEQVNGPGDGNTEPDWEITGDLTVNLRSERAGSKDDRIYTIHIECTDASGNTSTAIVEVIVPHDKGKDKK